MTRLLIHASVGSETATSETVFGGRPSAPQGALEWPVCSGCKGNMQFLGQLRTDVSDRLLLMFMCQNDPGGCSEWDADAGANKVLPVAATTLRLVEPPASGETLRPIRHGASLVDCPEDDYEVARTSWATTNGLSPRQVLGQMGGTPMWIQGKEVPACDSCAKPMDFVAQLEEGPDWETAMNFGGGGCAYVFHCSCDTGKAKLLWQC